MNVWEVLGIEPTRDRKTIKRAFARRVKIVRPEEDSEGYQELREAYDTILNALHEDVDGSVFGDQSQAWQKEEVPSKESIDAAPSQEPLEVSTDEDSSPTVLKMADHGEPEPPSEPQPEAANWHLDEDELDESREATVDDIADYYVDQLLTLLNDGEDDKAIEAFDAFTQSEAWENEQFQKYFEYYILASILEIPWNPVPFKFIEVVSGYFDWSLENCREESRFHFLELEGRFLSPMRLRKEINTVLNKKIINPFRGKQRAIKALFGPKRPILFSLLTLLPDFFNIYHIRSIIAQAPPESTEDLRQNESWRWWSSAFKGWPTKPLKLSATLVFILGFFILSFELGWTNACIYYVLYNLFFMFGGYSLLFRAFLIKGADLDFKRPEDDL